MVRNTSIDYAKGVAILFVVMSHVLQHCIYGNSVVFSASALERFFISVQMPLFMFLSGLVAKNVAVKDIIKDCYKRFRTIIMPFLVVGCLYTLIVREDILHPYSFLLKDFKCGYWYLLILFYCYLTNYALSWFGQFERMWAKVVKMICAIALWKVIGFCAGKYCSVGVADLLCLKPFLIWIVPYFFIGNFIKSIDGVEKILKKDFTFVLCFFVVLCGNQLNILYTLSLVVILYLVASCFDGLKGASAFRYIGQNSIYIYCFHFFALGLMDFTFLSSWMTEYSSVFVDACVALIPSVFAIIFSIAIRSLLYSNGIIHRFIFGR